MSAKNVLNDIAAAFTIAGPLLARFGLEPDITAKIGAGLEVLLKALDRLQDGAEEYAAEVAELLEEFRQLQAEGGIDADDLRAKADAIKAKAANLRAVVDANRG